MLKNTKPQLLLILGMLLVAVLFSLFKAVSSLSATTNSPDYDRTPPAAFADVPRITLYDSQGRKERRDFDALSSPDGGLRLPDDSYVLLLDQSKDLSEKVFAQTLEQSDLITAGMSPAEARDSWSDLSANILLLSGEKVTDVNYNRMNLQSTFITVSGSEERLAAGLVESVVDFDTPIRPGAITYNFVNEKEDDWRLLSMRLDY